MADLNVAVNLVANVGGADTKLGLVAQTLKTLKSTSGDAAGALGVFGVNLSALDNPLTLIAQGLKASIDGARQWGDDMGDLAQLTGATVRETSQMAATLELMGVGADTLKTALKTMTQQGLQLNLDTLKRLSVEYQAIQDPIARNEFLFKKFGKTGLELAEVMGRDREEIERLGKAAQYSGKVIDEDAAQAAEKFNVQLAILKQKGEGAAIAVGNVLIPTLSGAVEGYENWVSMMAAVNLLIQKNTGLISEEQAALRAQALAAGDVSAVYTEQYAPAILSTTDAIDRQNERTLALANSTATLPPNVDAMTASAGRWKGLAAQAEAEAAFKLRLEELTGAASDLQFGMGDLTTATLFHQAAQGLDADAAFALAESMGLIDPAAAAAKEILDELRVKYDSNRDGAIDAKEAAAGYTYEVGLLGAAVNTLPSGKVVTIEYIEQYRREIADEMNRGNDQVGGAVGDGYAAGGMAYGPTSGHWELLHGDERVLSPEQTRAYNAGALNNTITVDARGASDPAAVELAAYRGAQRALEEVGRQAEARLRI